jgi:hypothetical protein
MGNDDSIFTSVKIKAFQTRHNPMDSSQLNPYVD